MTTKSFINYQNYAAGEGSAGEGSGEGKGRGLAVQILDSKLRLKRTAITGVGRRSSMMLRVCI